jgi:O-antigen/teichoic acid export membrane protein
MFNEYDNVSFRIFSKICNMQRKFQMEIKAEGLAIKSLGRNIFKTLMRQGLNISIGLGLSILLARILGPTGNGQYAMAILLPTMFASFLNLGVAPANVYFIASKRTTLLVALKSSIKIWFLLSLIGILISTVAILIYGDVWFPGITKPLLWLAIIAFPISLLQSFLISLFQGIQDFKSYNYALLIAPSTTLFLAIILVGVMELGVFGALLAFICGQLVGLMATLIVLRPIFHRNKEFESNNKSHNYILQCLKYGLKAHMSNILTFINYRADLFLVNFFLTPAATGIYVIAVMIAEQLWILSNVVSAVLFPRLSELHEEENKRKILTPMIARWVLFVSLVGAIIMTLIASPVISILYGSEYKSAYIALVWLLPGIIFGSMTRILSNDIASRGKPELNFYVAILVMSANVILNIILITRMGIKGAAIATTIAYSIDAIVKLWIYGRLSKNPWHKSVFLNSNDLELFKKGLHMIKNRTLLNKN